MTSGTYVLITPARDEERFLADTIRSVLAQTLRPLRWVIVDDGSRDETGAIADRAAREHAFIEVIHAAATSGRTFGSKVRAFDSGYARVRDLPYEFLGNLDADATFPPDYYARIIAKMNGNPKLGAATGIELEKHGAGYRPSISNSISPPGPALFFRRRCFEEVGGYPSVTAGGEDSIAILTARMKGWETRSFADLHFYHHKPMGASAGNPFRRSYRDGITDYHIGTHPLFALLKAVRRLRKRPWLLYTLVRLAGYFRLWLGASRRDAPPELVRYVYREQMTRLKSFLRSGSI
jgi:glycosyltransferase involved in cell wall biosynthesis